MQKNQKLVLMILEELTERDTLIGESWNQLAYWNKVKGMNF